MKKVQRNSRDRLFKMIFGRPENKAWTLSLYNAVNGSNYDNPDDIELTTIENTVYMGMANDVSFLIEDVMNLYEQQSTFNPNMPMRMLIYAGMLYSKYIEGTDRVSLYSTRQQKFPTPKLICFYNGSKDLDDKVILKLRDAFNKPDKTDIDATVTMLNINHGHNRELMESCQALKEYSIFVTEYTKVYRATNDSDRAIEDALSKLPKESLIERYIKANKAEVKMSILTEYDEEKTLKFIGDEMYAEGEASGMKKGEAKGRRAGLLEGRINSIRQILQKLSVPEILELGFFEEEIALAQQE